MREIQELNRFNPGNPNLSVLALLTQGSFYKVLAVVGAMAALECMNFRLSACFFLAALGAVFLILCIMENEPGGVRSGYTWQRLRITRKRFFILKTLYNILCFVLLFTAQSGLGLWFCYRYDLGMPRESLSPQLVFLTFYRWEFLHCLLPMAEILKWIRNILLILSFSMTAAVEASVSNWKNTAVLNAVIYIMTLCWFVTPIGINTADLGLCLVYCAVCITAVCLMNKRQP